jgi:hypothetical protein
MKTTNGTWESIKAGYLGQVEKALASAGHREKKQVLEDVRSHLDQRFSELGDDEQTWENMQAIITEMGPASDYAELLAPDTLVPRRSVGLRHFWWIGVITIVIASAILAPRIMAPKVGYIVSFRLTQMYKNITARELLDKFNQVCPPSVRTHHYRTQIQGNNLVGFIVVDTEEDKASLYNALLESKELMPWTVRSVTQKEFERHCALGQPSLKAEDDQRDPIGSAVPPMVVATTPVAFDNDVSRDLKEITVTFDKPMMNLSWSWVGGGETFPEMMGQPRYAKNKRTCALPVKLEAGRFYWVGINSPQHKYFQTDMQVAAVPYVILFATRDENGEPTPIPENFLEEARSINSVHSRPVDVEAFRDGFTEKLEKFNIDNADLQDVISTFGEPVSYVWGQEKFDSDNLPQRCIVKYPDDFSILFSEGKISELRHEGQGTNFTFMGKIKIGTPLAEVLDVFGMPDETVEGGKNLFQDNVLYMDIDGIKGHCYYGRTDKNARLWFSNYEVDAIYTTRSDYSAAKVCKPQKIFETIKRLIIEKLSAGNNDRDAADTAKRWLGLIDDGDYGASWEEAADIFKNAATKERWADMAKTVREPLGKVISRQVMSQKHTKVLPGLPPGEYVIIQFKTSFENKADTIETVTPMLDKDGIWRVSGYYIK